MCTFQLMGRTHGNAVVGMRAFYFRFRSQRCAVRGKMAALFSCCLGCCGDGGSGHVPLKEMPAVQLDTHHMGKRQWHRHM